MENKFNTERTWGVEIENIASHGQIMEVCRKCTERGVMMRYEGYTHVTMRHWKVVTDSSCGYELVSPPLKGEEGFRQLKVVCDVMKEVGVKVNKKCGLHVHHDAHDLTALHFKRLYYTYIRFEKTIDSMLPISRRENNNTYCRTLRNGYSIEKLRKAKTIQQVAEAYGTRYIKLNTESYMRHGTVEFRHHSGTVEFEKIMNWIMLTSSMVTKAKESNVKFMQNPEFDNWAAFKAMLNLTAAKGATQELVEMAKFYAKRIKKLNVTGNVELETA